MCAPYVTYLSSAHVKKTRKPWRCDICGFRHEKGGEKLVFNYINHDSNGFESANYCADTKACTERLGPKAEPLEEVYCVTNKT